MSPIWFLPPLGAGKHGATKGAHWQPDERNIIAVYYLELPILLTHAARVYIKQAKCHRTVVTNITGKISQIP